MNEEAKTKICNEILEIMAEHDRQEARGHVDTPGGIEHKGDVFKMFARWRTSLTQPA